MYRNASRLFFLSILIMLFACAPKRVEIPTYEGSSLTDVLSSYKDIYSIDTTFSATFEREDTEIRGDGIVRISDSGDMDMRIYSFGFLAFELSSKDGVIKSEPRIDNNKSTILTYGLRDCLFWWDIKDYDLDESLNDYILINSQRHVWINKKTMLPTKRVIFLDDGKELDIIYENPEKFGDLWYPSKLRIEFAKYAVVLRLKDMSVIRRG